MIAGNGNIGFSGDNGPATHASLDDPTGIALDSKGYLYICDTINDRIRKIFAGWNHYHHRRSGNPWLLR